MTIISLETSCFLAYYTKILFYFIIFLMDNIFLAQSLRKGRPPDQ